MFKISLATDHIMTVDIDLGIFNVTKVSGREGFKPTKQRAYTNSLLTQFQSN